ncbi:hypothetical protein GG344DRAFT_32113, partial [Lentinula edodes]
WEKPWSQPKALDSIPTFYNMERSKAIFDTVGQLYRDYFGSDCPGFRVKGNSIDEIASDFKNVIKSAISSGTWDVVLSPNRHFSQLRITATGEQEYVTSGPGLEQSVLNALFDEYFATREFEFCTPIWDAYTTLITLPQTASAHISDAKKEELTIFGAVTALALIYGHYPGHLNPLLLIYLLNDSKLQSLHRDLVTALNGRTFAGHQSLAYEMLHNAMIGPVGVGNPFFTAFLHGFRLSC